MHPLPPVEVPGDNLTRLVPRAASVLDDDRPCAFFFDTDMFRSQCQAILRAFPQGESRALHALAMKANPVSAILQIGRELGMGVEVASPGELEHALRLGFSPDRIVLDSPAKTRKELKRALQLGVHINADNLEELARIETLLGGEVASTASVIGVRINPQLGEGSIAVVGTVAPTSKFGVPLEENRDILTDWFRRCPWLSAIHCHVGSQGCPLGLLVQGAQCVVNLAEEINASCATQRVTTLDLGGGMPVDYNADIIDSKSPHGITPEKFVGALAEKVPALFSGNYRIVTEYGRWVSAKCGLLISRVEYTKAAGGRRIASIHAGADVFLRTCYQPSAWPHRVSVWDDRGKFRDPTKGKTDIWDIVGPVCFRGDIVAAEILLPRELSSGDHIVVHDAGAYTLAMHSRYNSRQAPAVYGVSNYGNKLEVLVEQESMDAALAMWQAPQTEA